jgi:glycosyltransferase involved in cell wall biosynthesis
MTSPHHRVREIARHAKTAFEAAGECARALIDPMSDREQARADGAALSQTPSRRLTDPPRIVVDGVFFQLQNTGINRVWRALMARWSETGFARHVVVLDRMGTVPRFDGFTYRRMIPFRYHDSLAQRIALEAVCRAEHADLFISTYYTTTLTTRSLLYVYDMIPEVIGFDLDQRPWREKRQAIERASAYVAISDNTAQDLHRLYPATGSRPLKVAHNAVEPMFGPADRPRIDALRCELGLPADYVIFVGPRDLHYKNAALVFDALPLLPAADLPALLCVGGHATLEAEFATRAAATTVRVATLTDAQLAAAYSGALALIYPSRYEGFGLPILEAMACGCPVIACDNSSIAEAAGDAAIYVPEDDPSALAAAVTRLRDLSTREAYRARGFARVSRFDWKRTADDVERFIRDVASRTEREA